MMQRDKAGVFEVKGGTGEITRMCVVDGCLEIYKIDKTFRAISPDGMDPDKRNPNMPWVISEHSDIGSAHPVVARILLQSEDILKSTIFERDIDKESILSILHDSKEQILICEKVYGDLSEDMFKIEKPIKENGVEMDERMRSINPFPKIVNLDEVCARYLFSAKRVIHNCARMVNIFYGTEIDLPRFDKIKNWAARNLGEQSRLFQLSSTQEQEIVNVLDLRNYLEHPSKSKKTIIKNYTLLPNMSINCPQWHVTGGDPEFILDGMDRVNRFIFLFCENLFLCSALENASKNYPFVIYQEADEKVDKKCPILFRMSLDHSKLKFNDEQ